MLGLDDVRWELGRFGKLNVRHGKGSRRKGPKLRLVPLINGADRSLRWFVEGVWAQVGTDPTRQGIPMPARVGPSVRNGRIARHVADRVVNDIELVCGVLPPPQRGERAVP